MLGTRYYTNRFEHSLSYKRDDGSRMEAGVVHIPGAKEPIVSLAQFEPGAVEPTSQIEFSLEELRARYAFFSRLKADGLF